MDINYIVESWRPDTSDGSSKVSTRIMARQWNPTTTDHEWRYKRHTFNEWDWELDALDNHRAGVLATVRMDLDYVHYQQPAIVAGQTARGYLWIVTLSI
jgi:hypothetical protein